MTSQIITERRCKNCKKVVLEDSYKIQMCPKCKILHAGYLRKSVQKRKDTAKWKESVRRSTLNRGGKRITEGQYALMFNSQKGVCAICKSPPSAKKRLSVDHDHVTGYVRGLLCVDAILE